MKWNSRVSLRVRFAANWTDFAYRTATGKARSCSARGLCIGDNRMREYSVYVACPCCGETMQLTRTVAHVELPPIQTFECKSCGLAVTAEAVSGTMHALIEKSYPG
jgi:transcription elongation factor Elf1